MFNSGLKKHKPSRHDFSHRRTFGSLDVSQLPEEYLLVSTIKDQGLSFECTSFSACAVGESRYEKQFDPDQLFYDEGVVAGYQNPSGYDLRTVCDTVRKMGYTPLGGGDRIKEDSYFLVV